MNQLQELGLSTETLQLKSKHCIVVCVSVHYGSEMFGRGTTLVTHNLRTYYTSYCVITSRRNQGVAAEADTIENSS